MKHIGRLNTSESECRFIRFQQIAPNVQQTDELKRGVEYRPKPLLTFPKFIFDDLAMRDFANEDDRAFTVVDGGARHAQLDRKPTAVGVNVLVFVNGTTGRIGSQPLWRTFLGQQRVDGHVGHLARIESVHLFGHHVGHSNLANQIAVTFDVNQKDRVRSMPKHLRGPAFQGACGMVLFTLTP